MMIVALVKRWGLLAVGIGLLTFGAVGASQPLTFGWGGYPDGAFMRFSPPLVAMPASAALALLAGIALIGVWFGFWLGRRRRT